MTERSGCDHGPWVDIHAHPGCGFLGGLPRDLPLVQSLGGDRSVEQIGSAAAGEVSVVNASTVADLVVIGPDASGGLRSVRDFEPGEAIADHRRQVRSMSEVQHRDDVTAVLRADDIAATHALGQPGVFLSCEGGDFLDGSASGLDEAYRDGVRAITLVHYRVNELGDIQTEDSVHDGLTSFGSEVVQEMNRLGMIIDLAHATFETTVGALNKSSSPIMVSHSHLAQPGAQHARLLSEEHARLVADAGGIIGAWPSGVALTSLGGYADEICRLIDVVGVDHVAIGTDLDANYRPVLTSYSQFPEVAELLRERGLDNAEVDKVLGGNFVRLFADVEAAASINR